MDRNTLRVHQWLENVQPASPGAGIVSTGLHNFSKTMPASVRSTTNFKSLPSSSRSFLPPPKANQDYFKGSTGQGGMDLSFTERYFNHGSVPDKRFRHPASHSDVIRLRELGLIAAQDIDRGSGSRNADGIDPDDSASRCQHEHKLDVAPIRKETMHFNSKVEEQELNTPSIIQCYLDNLDNMVEESTSGEDDEEGQMSEDDEEEISEDDDEDAMNIDDDEDDNHEYMHATAPYLGETRKLILVTDRDDEAESHPSPHAADNQNAHRSFVHGKTSYLQAGFSSKPTNKTYSKFGTHEDAQAEKSVYQGVGTADHPKGHLKFPKPPSGRVYPALPPGKLLHGSPFELTPSEASDETAESFCTGDGEVVEAYDVEATRTPEFHHQTVQHLPQAAHVEGTFGHDGDVQVPIFPYPHQKTRCRAFSCPIKGRHEKGPYLHDGKLRAREGNIFGASNPPRKIWEAYDRIKDDGGRLGGKGKDRVAARDVKIVTSFARHHFGEAIEWGVGDLED